MSGGLKQAHVDKIRRVLSEHSEVEKAVLYGSRAKGTNRPGSDIDIALIGDQLDLQVLNKISQEFDDLLLPHNIDLCIYHQLDDADLVNHISRVGKVLYAVDPAEQRQCAG